MLKETIKIGDKSYIKAKVVMLPTNEKATFNHYQLCIDTEGYYKDKLVNIHQPNLKRVKPQHLYITSDEEIKENDWFYDKVLNFIYQTDETTDFKYINQTHNCFKVIASTDLSLKFGEDIPNIIKFKSLPQPSPQFIEKYIEEYNKSNIITDVMVEYETKLEWTYSRSGRKIQEEGEPFLKVDKNNYITITKVKNSWSRDEVISFAEQYARMVQEKGIQLNGYKVIHNQKWIEENL